MTKEESLDISRFILPCQEAEEIVKQFLCPVCLQIVNVAHKNPPIASNTCPHFFCNSCFTQIEITRGSPVCPICCAIVAKAEMRRRHPQLVNILETFSVRCRNAEKGNFLSL
eukprot:TRINITY_DN23259_c0_g1_i1.p1 TRINITY_DN23259_c0_g1~~TRINITY_DN23259_c0_g1_i1.p1  ORF type:complete len:112 (+),score=15.70 TRINITY_DN23259_c0_g1_i1:141-476(+)